MNIFDTIVSFETAKLLKEIGFDLQTNYFYTKYHKVKLFGIDEYGRSYTVKNQVYKLYKIGRYAVLKEENVYYAPTQSLAQKWLRDIKSVDIDIITVRCDISNEVLGYEALITNDDRVETIKELNLYEKILEKSLQKAIKIIKDDN